MQVSIILFLVFIFISPAFPQWLAPDKYWIPFTDKNNSEYSINKPTEFLSPEALERRSKQGIPVIQEDIPVVKEYIDSLKSMGLDILGTSRWFNAAVVFTEDIDLIRKVRELVFVRDFDPDNAFRIPGGTLSFADSMPVNLRRLDFFHNDHDYGNAYKQISLLQGKSLHDRGYTGQGMKIALMDAGFYRVDSLEAFKKLWNENRILGYKDFVNNDSDIFSESSHGLGVLSTMAAYLPGLMIGTAPEAGYWLLRTEDSGSEFKIEEANWVMAAEYADSAGADIIISSLGYNIFNDSAMNYSFADMDGKTTLVTRAAEKAFRKGIIVVLSAGNEGNKSWKKITAPSDAKNVLSVGSVDTSNYLSAFSSRGPSYDGRIKPDVLAVGYQTVIINSAGIPGLGYGTSYSAPQIAGLTACLWQAMPEKSNLEIMQAIIKSSDRYASPDNDRGYGIPNFLLALYGLENFNDTTMKVWVFPNPYIFSFEVFFDIEVTEIKIIDITGKDIISIPVNLKPYEKKVIIPDKLSPGMYILVGRNNSQQRNARIIKQ